MTNEELQAHISAINSACERGEVENRSTHNSGNWTPRIHRLLSGDMYRIKPKPLEAWFNVYYDAICGDYSTKELAKEAATCLCLRQAKFREVIE